MFSQTFECTPVFFLIINNVVQGDRANVQNSCIYFLARYLYGGWHRRGGRRSIIVLATPSASPTQPSLGPGLIDIDISMMGSRLLITYWVEIYYYYYVLRLPPNQILALSRRLGGRSQTNQKSFPLLRGLLL